MVQESPWIEIEARFDRELKLKKSDRDQIRQEIPELCSSLSWDPSLRRRWLYVNALDEDGERIYQDWPYEDVPVLTNRELREWIVRTELEKNEEHYKRVLYDIEVSLATERNRRVARAGGEIEFQKQVAAERLAEQQKRLAARPLWKKLMGLNK